MLVKMLSLSAGPNGVRLAGSLVEVPDAEEKQLIAGGYAELHRDLSAEKAARAAQGVETADKPQAGAETAAKPTAGKGKGKPGKGAEHESPARDRSGK